jgi:endonuclease/exonuclease/phosphatase family metal-dependent hydrolase
MAKLFSVASWNVEHFHNDLSRIQRVVDFLNAQKPDVFGLYEVEGKTVCDSLTATMPDYTFQITEGDQTQEILIGVRKTLTAFITQRVEFKSGTTHMRPGQLVTIRKDDDYYALLFLHLASGSDPRGMGLRDDMLDRAMEFRKPLDKTAGGAGKARYIFLGDLNTMGMNYPFDRDVSTTLELQKWDGVAAKRGMRRLVKTHDFSWSNGSKSRIKPSNLDHVFASSNLKFNQFQRPDGSHAEVAVRGWTTESTVAKQDEWIKKYSDHSLVYFEVAE